jgi:hypothetical protein
MKRIRLANIPARAITIAPRDQIHIKQEERIGVFKGTIQLQGFRSRAGAGSGRQDDDSGRDAHGYEITIRVVRVRSANTSR